MKFKNLKLLYFYIFIFYYKILKISILYYITYSTGKYSYIKVKNKNKFNPNTFHLNDLADLIFLELDDSLW